jgi:hypothetical protein
MSVVGKFLIFWTMSLNLVQGEDFVIDSLHSKLLSVIDTRSTTVSYRGPTSNDGSKKGFMTQEPGEWIITNSENNALILLKIVEFKSVKTMGVEIGDRSFNLYFGESEAFEEILGMSPDQFFEKLRKAKIGHVPQKFSSVEDQEDQLARRLKIISQTIKKNQKND